MSDPAMDELMNDDSSHYEISLTAAQAFIAFVLLLLSLGASFAFGVVIGRGQIGERLVVQRQPTVITEGEMPPANASERIVEIGTPVEETVPSDTAEPPSVIEDADPDGIVANPPLLGFPGAPENPAASTPSPAAQPAPSQATPAPASQERVPHFVQLLSTQDKESAEELAVRLIRDGFTTAYVERVQNEGGTIHRVRVRFGSESEARAAVPKLKPYVSGDVWVTRQ